MDRRKDVICWVHYHEIVLRQRTSPLPITENISLLSRIRDGDARNMDEKHTAIALIIMAGKGKANIVFCSSRSLTSMHKAFQ